MYSVFYYMSEFITNVVFGILERIFLKERPAFEEKVNYTLKFEHGWLPAAMADERMFEYRSKNLFFRPRIYTHHETNAVRSLELIEKPVDPQRIYISWNELASDEFFGDVEKLFRKLREKKVL